MSSSISDVFSPWTTQMENCHITSYLQKIGCSSYSAQAHHFKEYQLIHLGTLDYFGLNQKIKKRLLNQSSLSSYFKIYQGLCTAVKMIKILDNYSID
jgi:hypothetical protein